METQDPSPEGRLSQDDAGLWMNPDSNPVTDHTESPLCGEKAQDESSVTPPAPAGLHTRYYGVMDDEGADEVFVPPPPPSYMAPLRPTEGSRDAMVDNPPVTLANGAADATEAKANPSGLVWHHGEKHLMAVDDEGDEVKARTVPTAKESTDATFLAIDKDSTLPTDQTSTEGCGSLMETYHGQTGGHHQDDRTGDQASKVECEDGVTLSGGQTNPNNDQERERYPQQAPSSIEENSDNERCFAKEGARTNTEDICGLAETDSALTTENTDCDRVEAKALARNPDPSPDQRQVTQIPGELSTDDQEHVDTRSLDYNLTRSDWARRASGTSETQVPRLSNSEGSEEKMTKGDQGDGNRKISNDIQQGEQLLQRLEQLQLRQDVHNPESPHTSQEDLQETRGETKGVLGAEVDEAKGKEGVDEKEKEASNSVEDEGGIIVEKIKNDSEDAGTKAMTSSSMMPAEQDDHMIAKADSRDSDDDCPQIPFPSSHLRFSASEASIERQISEAAQAQQNLQRASGLFNLTDNEDVLEIPFKTNISLEPLTTTVGPDQHGDRQFSEQKMQKEISREIQRELVLVNQGKIPGGYSKGECRQIKETKLLFEAFQQNNTEGPTRLRKSPTSLRKGPVYPSVLERTRSLERFSVKCRPVSRVQSLRLYKSEASETEQRPENSRSKSPNGGAQDKTHLLPLPKQDKATRLCRSMDSISSDGSASAVETGSKTGSNRTCESPILKHNPFYKLRPALALQPEVEKDIREAKEREEELRRQRCTLYGENRQKSEDGEKSRFTVLVSDTSRPSRGKLERVWPPPSRTDQGKPEQTQLEPKVHRAGGQKAPLWQRWESGLVNGQPSEEKN